MRQDLKAAYKGLFVDTLRRDIEPGHIGWLCMFADPVLLNDGWFAAVDPSKPSHWMSEAKRAVTG